MLILSNGLTEVVDEGFLKVANSLVKRIKKADPTVTVVSYERKSSITDYYLSLNKLLLNRELILLIRKHNDSVLYIPFPAKTLATALRIFILSLLKRKHLKVILVMKSHMNLPARVLLMLSNADLIVLSKDAEVFYQNILPSTRVKYLKTGVDTSKFVPAQPKRMAELKEKYGFDPDRPIILHVGHLKQGRNVGELVKIDKKYQVLLVTSTLTKEERDIDLQEKLLNCPNIRIIDEYIPNIEEIYQMSDIYFFPTKVSGNCIDVPLSCMEAAACNKPVITTDYGEMKEFIGKSGFYFIDENENSDLNRLIERVLCAREHNTRDAVLEYDWNNAIGDLLMK